MRHHGAEEILAPQGRGSQLPHLIGIEKDLLGSKRLVFGLRGGGDPDPAPLNLGAVTQLGQASAFRLDHPTEAAQLRQRAALMAVLSEASENLAPADAATPQCTLLGGRGGGRVVVVAAAAAAAAALYFNVLPSYRLKIHTVEDNGLCRGDGDQQCVMEHEAIGLVHRPTVECMSAPQLLSL
ncbi:unnamed protein product [Boreogadus saida]